MSKGKPFRTTLRERLALRREARLTASRRQRYLERRAEVANKYYTPELARELLRILEGPDHRPNPYEFILDRQMLISQEVDLACPAPFGKSA